MASGGDSASLLGASHDTNSLKNALLSASLKKMILFFLALLIFYLGYLFGSAEEELGWSGSVRGASGSKYLQREQDVSEVPSSRWKLGELIDADFDNDVSSSGFSTQQAEKLEDGVSNAASRSPSLKAKAQEATLGPTFHNQTNPVTSINLIGERHSGTNWITDHLIDCFNNSIEVLTQYTRFKHWFQYDDPTHFQNSSSVVIAMFRDPYDWVEAMRERPHHSHDHIGLNWRNFVTKPWRGKRGAHDQMLLRNASEINTLDKSRNGNLKVDVRDAFVGYADCLNEYTFEEIIPCSPDDSPRRNGYGRYFYELMHDGSGRAYESIINLRRDKILNFLDVANFPSVRAFYPMRYEDLSRDGTARLLQQVENVAGVKADCAPIFGRGNITHKEVDRDYIRWMNQYVDWDTELLLGYNMRPPSE